MSTTHWLPRYSHACLATARGAAILAAAALPFSTAATNVLFALVLLAWLLSGRLAEMIRAAARHPLAAGAAAMLCYVLLAMLWSDAAAGERTEALLGYRKLLLLVVLIPLFDTPRRRAALLFTFLGALVAMLLWSIATHFGVGGLTPDPLQGAIVKRNHITHGFMMALLAFAMATLAMNEVRPGWRAAEWAVAALAVVNLMVMTRGRTGWLIALSLLVLAAVLRARWKGGVAAVLAVAVLGTAAYSSVPAVQERVAKVTSDLNELAQGNVDTSTGIRLHFYERAFAIVRDNAFLGAGTGAWKVEYERRSANDPEALRYVSGAGNAHSDYLTTAVQFGLVGVLLHLALIVGVFVLAGRLPAPDMWMARALVVGYAVGAVFNSFLLDFGEGHVVVLLLAALFGGAWPPSRDGRPTLATQHAVDFLDHARRR